MSYPCPPTIRHLIGGTWDIAADRRRDWERQITPKPAIRGRAPYEPTKTLKAGVHGVPNGENMLRRSDGSVRYFTIRESARLQTFPYDLVFHGSLSETMRQLGNAVPVSLMAVVARSVKALLDADQVNVGARFALPPENWIASS